MGLRLQLAGWRIAFTPDTHVSQQGLTRLRPLMRQRARWYQGHLQCWSRIALLLSSRQLSAGRTADLLAALVLPVTVLLFTLSLVAFVPSMATHLLTAPDATLRTLIASRNLLFWWYLLFIGMIALVALVYWSAAGRTSGETNLRRAFGCAFLFYLYTYLWLPVAWWATWRLLRGQRGWAKTLRLVDKPASPRLGPAR
jgi:cellulose synthase/poly-beta-1,6-N-acetylglucosamine synthase-like glycosyltransferase